MATDRLVQVREAFAGLYPVQRAIGRGGAACVYLARDPAGQDVALKVLHPELGVSISAERFQREIAFLAHLHHPRILRLLDAGERPPFTYCALPYVAGPTLAECLVRVRHLSVDDTIRLGTELLEALAAAHRQSVVHRDVKPTNVLISNSGVVLADFGIAKALEESVDESLTRSGITLGTSAYMSPEQAEGLPQIDHRADLYATGCVLFEALAGRPPFVHRNEQVTLRMQIEQPAPSILELRPDTPAYVATTIARALIKAPAERWLSAEQMALALRGGEG